MTYIKYNFFYNSLKINLENMENIWFAAVNEENWKKKLNSLLFDIFLPVRCLLMSLIILFYLN